MIGGQVWGVCQQDSIGPGENHTFVGSYKLTLSQYTCIGLVVACSFQHLIITKGSLHGHLDKLNQIFIWLRDAGLKINATRSVFCAQETEYLGYILTRGGIKPQPKKVQAILMLNPPNIVKELQQFLGMVQYYKDMWQKHSEMLAPLTNLVRECGGTKTVVPMEITFMDNGGNIFVLCEFIDYENSHVWSHTSEFIHCMNSHGIGIHIGFWFLPWAHAKRER